MQHLYMKIPFLTIRAGENIRRVLMDQTRGLTSPALNVASSIYHWGAGGGINTSEKD